MTTFTPPLGAGLARGDPDSDLPADRLFSHYPPIPTGHTVWKDQLGAWHESEYPYAGRSDSPGLHQAQHVFEGGHVHIVSLSLADELIAAGFGDGIGDYPVSQTTADAENERWLNTIRAEATYNYLGGDVTDVGILGDGRAVWVGSDWFAGGSVDGDDTFGSSGPGLPFRNGAFVENPPGTIQSRLLTSATWITPNQATHPGRWYWPICAIGDGSTLIIGAWLMEQPNPATPWGRFVDNHILTVETVFGSLTGATPMNLPYDRRFRVLDFYRDTTTSTWYILGQEHNPPFESGYGLATGTDLSNSITFTRLARSSTTLMDTANYEYWTGSGWSEILSDAKILTATTGEQIPGDTGIHKLSDGNWMLASHQITEPFITLYTSSTPTGPWRRRISISAPDAGGAAKNGGTWIGQFVKFIPHLSAPANHIQTMVTRNHLNATTPSSGWHIDTFAPLFTTVPTYLVAS